MGATAPSGPRLPEVSTIFPNDIIDIECGTIFFIENDMR